MKTLSDGTQVSDDTPTKITDGEVTALKGTELADFNDRKAAHSQMLVDEAAAQAVYEATEKYKDDRRAAYGPVEGQLDMIYWDQVNATTIWRDHVTAVKAAHPKPA
ncbi:MAG: hypothetical protein IH994_07190 [Proteobacteria bacterium]|nr:hypothetical protein [Pseudomonadota bacterium]